MKVSATPGVEKSDPEKGGWSKAKPPKNSALINSVAKSFIEAPQFESFHTAFIDTVDCMRHARSTREAESDVMGLVTITNQPYIWG